MNVVLQFLPNSQTQNCLVLEKIKLWLLPLIFKILLLLLTATCKVRWHNRETLESMTSDEQGFLLSFWHENVLIIPWLLRHRGWGCMVSDSRDGAYIARIGELFGNRIIRGSSSKGATRATRAALKLLRSGGVMSITPDGPRGPAHKLQSGVLWLSALGQVPILPFHIEVDRQWRFRSWDGQKLPKPFATIYASVGEPVTINRSRLETAPEESAKEVEELMIANTNNARQLAKHDALPID